MNQLSLSYNYLVFVVHNCSRISTRESFMFCAVIKLISGVFLSIINVNRSGCSNSCHVATCYYPHWVVILQSGTADRFSGTYKHPIEKGSGLYRIIHLWLVTKNWCVQSNHSILNYCMVTRAMKKSKGLKILLLFHCSVTSLSEVKAESWLCDLCTITLQRVSF